MQNLAVTIQQDGYSKQIEVPVNEQTTLSSVAAIVTNAVHSYMATEKVLVPVKNRAKLNKPFLFDVQLEDQDGKELKVIPQIRTKIALSEDGINLMVNNMELTLKHILIPLDMPVKDRIAKLKANANEILLIEG